MTLVNSANKMMLSDFMRKLAKCAKYDSIAKSKKIAKVVFKNN